MWAKQSSLEYGHHYNYFMLISVENVCVPFLWLVSHSQSMCNGIQGESETMHAQTEQLQVSEGGLFNILL